MPITYPLDKLRGSKTLNKLSICLPGKTPSAPSEYNHFSSPNLGNIPGSILVYNNIGPISLTFLTANTPDFSPHIPITIPDGKCIRKSCISQQVYEGYSVEDSVDYSICIRDGIMVRKSYGNLIYTVHNPIICLARLVRDCYCAWCYSCLLAQLVLIPFATWLSLSIFTLLHLTWNPTVSLICLRTLMTQPSLSFHISPLLIFPATLRFPRNNPG